MEKKSSLPPSIQPFIWTRPQVPQGLSPTASSPGAVEEAPELPVPIQAPPRQAPFPALPPLPSTFPDTRRQYPGYDTGAHDPVGVHVPAGLSAPERLAGSSSIPHGSAGRYRSPAISDPRYPVAGPSHVPSPPSYPGSQSLPALSQITGAAGHWREGEAGPSSLVHSHPYGDRRRPSPSYLPPQPIYRRATEPGSYSTGEGPYAQPGFHSSYERLRDLQHPEDHASNLYSELPRLPPVYARAPEGIYGARLPPLYSALPSQSTASFQSDLTRVEDDESSNWKKRKLPSDFDENPVPRKILVACDFCRRRKLKCDGNKPGCSNCYNRREVCEYRLHAKRRGPGKAAKGSRAKKRIPKTGRNSEPSARGPDGFEGIDIAPQLRSRASFPESVYSTTSTLVEGRYEWTPPQKRRKKRAPSSEYDSTEDEESRQ